VHPTDNKEICGIARGPVPASGLKRLTIVAYSQHYSDFGPGGVFDRSGQAQKDRCFAVQAATGGPEGEQERWDKRVGRLASA
jgi:hypothetical protein